MSAEIAWPSPEPEPPGVRPLAAPPRSRAAGFVHRLVLAYLAWTILPLPAEPAFVRFTATHVLGLDAAPLSFAGASSGDRLVDWIGMLNTVLVAVCTTAIWAWIDRNRPFVDARITEAVRVAVRYSLASTMLAYGLAKVFGTQMPAPTPGRLLQPVGQMSPMGLLWTFMGHSLPYQMLGGAAEVIGALLLLPRRTTTVGALLVAAVMANVVALNLCYDVPVKRFSTQLLGMALFLLMADATRLWDVFVRNRPVDAVDHTSALFTVRWKRAARFAKLLVVLALVGGHTSSAVSAWRTRGRGAPLHPLEGLYDVEALTTDGREAPATRRWRRLQIGHLRFDVYGTGGTSRAFVLQEDDTTSLKLREVADRTTAFDLVVRPDGPEHLWIEGSYDGSALSARVRRLDASSQPLNTRGFHWISEAPFNR